MVEEEGCEKEFAGIGVGELEEEEARELVLVEEVGAELKVEEGFGGGEGGQEGGEEGECEEAEGDGRGAEAGG